MRTVCALTSGCILFKFPLYCNIMFNTKASGALNICNFWVDEEMITIVVHSLDNKNTQKTAS